MIIEICSAKLDQGRYVSQHLDIKYVTSELKCVSFCLHNYVPKIEGELKIYKKYSGIEDKDQNGIYPLPASKNIICSKNLHSQKLSKYSSKYLDQIG